MGQEGVGHPEAVGLTVAWVEACCERRLKMRHEKASRAVQSVLEAAAEGRLCLLEEAGVADLHVMEAVEGGGPLSVTGLG